MIISHKHKFVTIDVPKTGTSSINSVLRRVVGKNDFTPTMSRKMGVRHSTYEQCIKKIPSCKKYFVFAFVRNPWDRLVSFWFYKKYRALRKITEDVPLRDFLLNFRTPHEQYTYIKGFGNDSFIGRFENLQQDFDIVCDRIGIPRQKLPHRNKTDHKHYTKYYDDETRQMVAEKYSKDIDHFGYEFGE